MTQEFTSTEGKRNKSLLQPIEDSQDCVNPAEDIEALPPHELDENWSLNGIGK